MSRNKKLIAIFESLRIRELNKNSGICADISCTGCPLSVAFNCMLRPSNKDFNLDKAIEIIDNYELPIKEYTLEELEKLPKGTMIEVSTDKKTWFERTFVAVYKNIILTVTSNNSSSHWEHARPIQEVK